MLDFNDAPRVVELNPGLKPDRDLIAVYLGVLFSYCSGFIPLRGFVEGGRSHNVWVDRDNPEVLDILFNTASYAAGAELASYLIPGTVAEHGQASQEHVRESQVLVCDIDTGAIGEKLSHAVTHLGPPTLVVESGGITVDGEKKVHAYWKLREAAAGEDLETLRRSRHMLAAKIGADLHFASLHQPIRIAGSVYNRRGRTCLVTIREHAKDQYGQDVEYELADLHEAVMLMPALTEHGGVAALDFNNASTARHNIADVLTRPVHEGGEDELTRFAALSTAIGYWLRRAHEGLVTREHADLEIHAYNVTQVRPPKDDKWLDGEIKRLWRKHVRENGEPKKPEIKTDLPLIWFDDIQANTESIDFVEDTLGEGQASVVYGESNVGKTFFVADIAFHVAWGKPWRGKAVDQGGVIYVALEGGFGIRNRVAAFRRHHHLDGVNLPFAIVPSSVNLLDPKADTPRLIELIKAAAERIAPIPIKMIVIDTLARAIAGGNENSSEDMGALVGNADRIRAETNAHLCFVHHSGKDQAKGARGHSSLRAAIDTEIELKRPEGAKFSVAKVVKQRDMESQQEYPFGLNVVELGTNRRNKPVTSCVVAPLDNEDAATAPGRPRLTPKETRALEILYNVFSDSGKPAPTMRNIPNVSVVEIGVFREALKRAGVTDSSSSTIERTQWNRLKEALDNKGYIRMDGALLWMP